MNIWKLILRYMMLIIGGVLASVALELLLVPNQVIDGGVVGISIMLAELTPLPFGIFLILLNIPFLIIGYKHIGKTFTISTLFAIVVLSISSSVIHNFHLDAFVSDIWLASVFGGVLLGVGVGIVVKNGGAMDGTEVLAILFDKKSSFSVGEIIMFFNLFILGASGFVFGFENALYSLLAYFIAFKVIDITVQGLNETKGVFIISDHNEAIAEILMQRLGRGVTMFETKGGYSNKTMDTIYVVVTRLEIAKLKEMVLSMDNNAMITVNDVELLNQKHGKKAIH